MSIPLVSKGFILNSFYISYYRSDLSGYHRCVNHTTLYPPPIGFSFHHNSCDELSSHKHQKACGHVVSFHEPSKASQEYQWPKVIPKSPSSFSMNSFRLQRHPPTFDGKCQNHNWLDDIESERRRSQASLFKETVNKTDFGTAVWTGAWKRNLPSRELFTMTLRIQMCSSRFNLICLFVLECL